MNRQCKCSDCGYVFDYDDRTVVNEKHGFDDGFYETFSCCPNCGGDFDDAADCCECGETFAEDELYDGWCESCLRNTINYDTFFEYCEVQKDEQYLDTFVMCYILHCEYVPKYSSYEFHELMVRVYKERVEQIKRDKAMSGKTYDEIIDDCIRFIMDDDGESGRENYADWLNKREVK